MPTNLLGISAFYHDAAACLVRDGKILAAAREERFSRIKHDPSFPAHAIRYCLQEGGIGSKELDAVAFYEKPWLKFEGLLETYLSTAPRGLRPFLMAMPLWLKEESIPHRRMAEEALLGEVSGFLEEGRVVGWLHGRMEFGPRALGHRSILGDARNPTMQSVLNLKIKGRESFRPFAPSCLAEEAGKYFELDRDSPYMLLVAPVRPERHRALTEAESAVEGVAAVKVARSDIPAVTHVDHSARVQTVRAETSPRYARLLEEFRRRTGYGVIVNTSFNVSGEPIVCTPSEAYRDFLETEMDVLVLEDCLLIKSEQDRERNPSDTSWFPAPPEESVAIVRKRLRRFGLLLAGGFGSLGGLLWWRSSWVWTVFAAIGIGLLVAGLVTPLVLGPVERRWTWMAEKLGGS